MRTTETTMLMARRETTERLEVVDEQGTTVGKVHLPSDPRLFGAEKGTVYLERTPPAMIEAPRPHAA